MPDTFKDALVWEAPVEVLAKAKEMLVEFSDDWDTTRHGLCFGDVMSLTGDLYICGHTACHSWASVGQFCRAYPSALVLSCHPKKHAKCKQESVDAYVKWLANGSAFSKFILNRDDEESLLNGGVVLYTGGKDGMTKAEMLWVCKTIRYAVEGSQALDTWKVLYDAGVDPLFAIAAASFVSNKTGQSVSAASVTYHGNVFNGVYINPKRLLTGNNLRGSTDTSELFEGNGENSFRGSKFSQFCIPVMKDDGWGKMIETSGANVGTFVENVLKWENELRTKLKLPKNTPEPVSIALPTSSTVYLEVDL